MSTATIEETRSAPAPGRRSPKPAGGPRSGAPEATRTTTTRTTTPGSTSSTASSTATGTATSGRPTAAPRVARSATDRDATADGPGGIAPFVLLTMVLLASGLVATLWLSTAAAADSYRLDEARQVARDLSEQSERLHREVEGARSAPALAAAAQAQGLVPAGEPAVLLVAPDGRTRVIGDPKPARGPSRPAAPAPAAPAAAAPATPAAPTTPSAPADEDRLRAVPTGPDGATLAAGAR